MKIEEKKRFEHLFNLYYGRTASYSELNEFYTIIRTLATDQDIAHFLEEAFLDFQSSKVIAYDFPKDTVFKRVQNEIRNLPLQIKSRPIIRLSQFLTAAVLLVFISIGLYFYKANRSTLGNYPNQKTAKRIVPGSNKAILTLSNGSSIVLNDSHNGVLAKEGQVVIRKLANGQISYISDEAVYNGQHKELSYNTISTPRGGQYQVVLPDGTKVWLNSSSSLRYPSLFSAKERTVELSGEGYFEVAKNEAKPFHVKIAGVDISVLGTHFNIMGYVDEPILETSLLEGAVRISKGTTSNTLSPGQQAIIKSNSDEIKVRTVDLEDAVAWKKGYFVFDNEGLESVMRKLSRWYDVEVVYDGKFKNAAFSGTISRFEQVSEVLKTLQLTEMVHFKIEGRRIIVME